VTHDDSACIGFFRVSRGISFPYERVLTPIGFVWIPVARVRLFNRSNALELDMTVDTGADMTMVPFQVGLNLGLRRGKTRLSILSGISGRTAYLLKKVAIEIGPFRFAVRIAWAQDDLVPALLGRTDVLDHLRTTFDGPRRQVHFAK